MRARWRHRVSWGSPCRSLGAEGLVRHTALDKMIGAALHRGCDPAAGFIVITSRCSYEMVKKSALFGATALVVLSAPGSFAFERAPDLRLIDRPRRWRAGIRAYPEAVKGILAHINAFWTPGMHADLPAAPPEGDALSGAARHPGEWRNRRRRRTWPEPAGAGVIRIKKTGRTCVLKLRSTPLTRVK